MSPEEFIKPEDFIEPDIEPEESAEPDELDVQRTVVEALAAEKAEMTEQITALKEKNKTLLNEKDEMVRQIASLKRLIGEQQTALENVGDVLTRNTERAESNQVSLLDRNVEIDDRFVGETRDHVLEVLREARDNAEKEGRIRRAQLLESVLVANEPVGELAKRRQALEKLFNDNGNILSGVVIAALEKDGISHKNGEEYLLASEIIKRTY